jgi:uroporphyrinogen decarboxylase
MAMSSREIVQRTLDFNNPERVAHSFEPSDFVVANDCAKTRATDWRKITNTKWERTDEWGNTWQRIDDTTKGEVVKGVLDDVSQIDSYKLPDYSNFDYFTPIVNARKENPDKWLIGGMPGFAFNIARKIFKIDNYLMALVLEREKIRKLHDRIDILLADMIRNHAKAGADCIMYPEDWGTQLQIFISPDLWYDEFFPRFEKLFGMAHHYGLKVFMHSCGKIGAIVPGLIKAGVDVLQFDQPDLHGIDNLAAYQKNHKITFWSPVDIQKTLQTKNEMIIRTKAREMLDKLWKGKGGFIAGFYTDNVAIGLEPKWQEIASDEFTEYCSTYHNVLES